MDFAPICCGILSSMEQVPIHVAVSSMRGVMYPITMDTFFFCLLGEMICTVLFAPHIDTSVYCHWIYSKEKKNMLSIATVLGFNNGFITVRDLEAFKIIVKNQSQP